MPIVERPNASVNYEIWGETGSWVTLINGHTRPLNDFRLLGRHLVERGHRVLALDNRGAGHTVVTAPFSSDDMADDVTSLWARHEVRSTHVLGISMGGFIASKLALSDAAHHMNRLILVSTAARHQGIRQDEAPWTADPAQVEAKLRPYFTDAFAERNATLLKSMAKQVAKAVEGGDFVERSALQRRAVHDFDVTSQLTSITLPTLVVHGADDRIIPVQEARALAEGIPGARLEILPGAGHLLLAERPRELYELVGAWFGEAGA